MRRKLSGKSRASDTWRKGRSDRREFNGMSAPRQGRNGRLPGREVAETQACPLALTEFMDGVLSPPACHDATGSYLRLMRKNSGAGLPATWIAAAIGNGNPARKKTCSKEKDGCDSKGFLFQYVPFIPQTRPSRGLQ